MKLEIKHVAPYLPYNMQYKVNGKTFTLKCINYQDNTKGFWINNTALEEHYVSYYNQEVRPLLHPMSRLTEPILPEDKILLVELAKTFSNPEFVWKVNTQDYYIECDTLGVWFGSTGKITIQHKCSGDTTTPSNQLEIYMKLFEWHFDVFGLIEQGLAIEKPLI